MPLTQITKLDAQLRPLTDLRYVLVTVLATVMELVLVLAKSTPYVINYYYCYY